VTVPSLTNVPYNTNEFTMECWLNFPRVTTAVTYVMGAFDPIGGHTMSMIVYNGTMCFRYDSSPGGNTFRGISKVIRSGRWHHCALTLTGNSGDTGNVRLFCDGVLQEVTVGTTSVGFAPPKVNMVGSALPLSFAQASNTTYEPFYLDSARVLLGNAAYTANFAKPDVLTYGPSSANTVLLLGNVAKNPSAVVAGFTGDVAVQGNVVADCVTAPLGVFGSAAAPALANGQMSFSMANDTTLTIRTRGTDGVLRSANITLA
jgi:hypothetical protein